MLRAGAVFAPVRSHIKSLYDNKLIGGIFMVPSIYGENMFDEIFGDGFFGRILSCLQQT